MAEDVHDVVVIGAGTGVYACALRVPSLSEAVGEAHMALAGKPLHSA
ncbi:MAG: hypothetical protein ACT4PO_06705 [Actinomycetota bacterium]